MYVWIIVVLAVLLAGCGVAVFRTRANKIKYGLVIDKRFVPGYLSKASNFNTSAGLMMGNYYVPQPDRYQLKLTRDDNTTGWVDVGEDEYKRVAVGTFWPT